MRRHLLAPLALLLLLLLPAVAGALTAPHDATNGIECVTCHSVHSAGGNAFKPAGAVQQALCVSCHNPTGQAAAMSDVAVHVVGGGTRTLWCADCHDPHGPSASFDPHGGGTAPNLAFLRTDVSADVPGALPLVFQQRPAQFAFGDAAQPWSGACQGCHTGTAHHTRDGTSDHGHGAGGDCTTCHAHGAGFLPAGCDSCHGSPVDDGDGIPAGGRRAVISEFPVSMAGHLAAGTVASQDCGVCHGFSRHQTGTVELLDPDGGAAVTFVRTSDVTTDPNVSVFCMRCHDADGARRLGAPLDPFGNGGAAPEVATRFSGTLQWAQRYLGDVCYGASGTGRAVNSHHDVTAADQAFSGARLECISCHSAHGASAATVITDPASPLTPWSGTMNAFCLGCHAGGAGPATPGLPAGVRGPTVALMGIESCGYTGDPWWVSGMYSRSAHGGGSKRGWPGYSGAQAYDMECTVCHHPHGSASATNPAGNPYLIRDFVDGTVFVDDGRRLSGWLGVGVARTVEIPVVIDGAGEGRIDYGGSAGGSSGLCNACHAQWLNLTAHQAYGGAPTCFNCNMCHQHGGYQGEWDFGSNTDRGQYCPP